jgi:hypothetical protein
MKYVLRWIRWPDVRRQSDPELDTVIFLPVPKTGHFSCMNHVWASRVNWESQIIKGQPMRDANRNVRASGRASSALTYSTYIEALLSGETQGTGVAGTSTALCGTYLHTGHRALSERGLETFCTALRIQNCTSEETKNNLKWRNDSSQSVQSLCYEDMRIWRCSELSFGLLFCMGVELGCWYWGRNVEEGVWE